MTDDDRAPNPGPRPAPRLDGPEALLTAEWTIPDFPGLEPPASAGACRPPKAPSQRRSELAAAARPGAAGSLPQRQFTLPRPQQPATDPVPAVVVKNLDVTLPPRAEREASPPCEHPSVRNLQPRRGRLYAAIATAAACTFGYALWNTVLRPPLAGAAPERRLPHFLRDAPPADAVESPAAAPVAAPPSQPLAPLPLPPSLAATLAQALPAATIEPISATAAVAADAGAPATAPVDEPPPSPPDPAPPEISERAAALRETLAARRPQSVEKVTPAKPTAAAPAPKTRAAPSSSRTPSSSKPPAAPAAPPSSTRTPVEPLTTYTYADKALFAVVTAPTRVTDLLLERGETLLSQPTAGDAARWVIRVVPSGQQTHVFVQPLRHPLRTNLTLTTTRRSYFLELSTRDDGSYMAGVAWTYPHDEADRRRAALAEAERERQNATAVSDLRALRFDYRIDVTAGTPAWKPNLVFDDGVRTFIRFPRPVAAPTAPVLFVLRSKTTRDAKYVNYRVKGDLYVIDRLIDTAELRFRTSDDEQDIVRISRKL